VVNLSYRSPNNITVIKTYTFYPKAYAVNVNYTLKNQSGAPLTSRFYGELSRMPPSEPTAFWNSYTNYVGAAISYPDNHYQKITFADMAKNPISQTVASGWVAMLQHYFITAWIPENNQTVTQFSSTDNTVYSIGLANPSETIASGQSMNTGATLYLGPAIASQLGQVAPYLDKTVDYGWLWFISELIFEVMQWIQHYVGNWGVAIIIVTILIKLMFYPLSSKSYRSMARMRELQPKIAELRSKFGDDRQKLGMATMELYRKEKVNPLGGCLPILIQIPVFIALYWVIMESVEFRQAPFFGWIHDLSARDPYFILPVLMGLSMFVQQKLSPKPPDPTQAKVMMFLPIIFTVMFLGFPSGLVLYWFVNNCLSVLQQWWVTRQTLKQDGYKNLSKHPSKWQGK
jgi:YidC/Oxa1 family membrane protein insertase